MKTWRRPQRKCERGKKEDRGRERRETKRRLSKRLKWKNKRKPSGRGKESWRNRPSKPQERTANNKTELVSDGTFDDGICPECEDSVTNEVWIECECCGQWYHLQCAEVQEPEDDAGFYSVVNYAWDNSVSLGRIIISYDIYIRCCTVDT